MPNDICPFRFWLAPSAHPHARSRPGPARSPPPPRQTRSMREPQTPERPRPPDCSAGKEGPRDKAAKARREALSGPGSRTQRAAGHAARGAAGPGKSYFSMKPPGPLPRGAGRASEQRVRAPTHPDFRTAAARERRSGSPSPRSSPASARRAHTGSTPPHTHSHALHTHSVSGPTPVPRNRKLTAPDKGPTQFTRPQPLLRRPGTGHPRPGVTKAAYPGGPPGRVPQHRADTARPAQTRGREEGAAPRLGLAPGIGYWGTPPPITTTFLCSTKGCRRNRLPRATYRWFTASPPPPFLEPRSRRQGRERRRAAAPSSGQRPPAQPAGYPVLSHRAQRQLPPGVVPASSSARLPALLPLAAEAQPVSDEPASCARLRHPVEGRTGESEALRGLMRLARGAELLTEEAKEES